MVLIVWCGAVALAIIGVSAAIGRGVFLTDLATQAEPLRQELLHSLQISDPFALHRAQELDQFDSRFAKHPLMTLLHIFPGGVFVTLALFQFSSRVRSRHIQFHRWSGRILVLAGFAFGLTALYFGLLMPYGGPTEAMAIVLFGVLFLGAISRAFIAVRRHQLACHREWMIRAFAVGIGISTARIVLPVLDITLTPAGFRSKEIFVLGLWTGWMITVGAAELWIRYTRPRAAQ